jgi:hypothetical protein
MTEPLRDATEFLNVLLKLKTAKAEMRKTREQIENKPKFSFVVFCWRVTKMPFH